MVHRLVEIFPPACAGDMPVLKSAAATKRTTNQRFKKLGRRSLASTVDPGCVWESLEGLVDCFPYGVLSLTSFVVRKADPSPFVRSFLFAELDVRCRLNVWLSGSLSTADILSQENRSRTHSPGSSSGMP